MKKHYYNFNTVSGNIEKVYLKKETYFYNKSLAVQMICEDGTPYMTVTVNLGVKPSKPNCAYVKYWTENIGVEDFLIKNNIAKKTGRQMNSGHVFDIAEFEFDLSKLDK